MSRPPESRGEPITGKRQLVEYLEAGCKPRERWRIGTEHEKLVFDLMTLRPAPYEGPSGIAALLDGMRRYGWDPIYEGDNVIAMSKERAAITLEPGGQFELSGAPLETIHQTCAETATHLAEVKQVAGEIGVGMLGLGMQPKWSRADTPWMPKGRYRIMRKVMEQKGSLGLDMMLRTCTIQTNLDFASEADMVKKYRVSLALQPVATALFANSPFTEGRPNGFKSFRSHVWTDTDPDRTGIMPFVFEDGMGFERFVDYLLDVPMYFVYRDGYVDASGQSFRDFMAGRLPALPGEIPGMGDFADHMTTSFPEVRLKRFLEMRGADGGPWRSICALPALWVGLLYDDGALDAAWDLVKGWTLADHQHLRAEVPRHALATAFHGRTMRDLAREVLEIAKAGLRARARQDGIGVDESPFLDTLHEVVDSGMTPADRLLEKYHGPWNGSVDPVFREMAY